MTHRNKAPATKRRQTDRKLRELVFELLADSSHAPVEAIRQMQQYVDWLKSGAVPGGAEVIRVERRETA